MKNRYVGKKTVSNRNKISGANGSVFISHNFSEVEDNANAFLIISKLAANAGNYASAEAKAAGLSRVYIRNYKDLVKVSPAGVEILISPKINQASFYVKYKPSTILHAVRK